MVRSTASRLSRKMIVADTGRAARINTDFLDVQVSLDTATAQTLGNVGGTAGAFQITGGGADFQLAGQVDIAGKVSLGIVDVATRKLGKFETLIPGQFNFLADLGSGKSLNVVTGNVTDAQKVVSGAIDQVSSLRTLLTITQ